MIDIRIDPHSPDRTRRRPKRARRSKSARGRKSGHQIARRINGDVAGFADAGVPESSDSESDFMPSALPVVAASDTDAIVIVPHIETKQPAAKEAPKAPVADKRGRSRTTLRDRFATPHVAAAPLPDVSVALAEPPPPEEVPYAEWFQENVLRSRWMTWFAAFYVHWLILLLLSVIYIHSDAFGEHVAINASMALLDDLPLEFVELEEVELEVDVVEEETAAPTLPSVEEVFVPEVELSISDLFKGDLPPQETSPAPSPSPSDSSEPVNKPVAKTVANPAPAGAVTAGSFSVWTIPDNPDPGEPYRIVIQVRLPEGTTRYNVADLDGVVVGSDGYRKPVPGSNRGELPVVSGYSRFVVHVVSADEKVEDTVFIRSRLLREAQKLQIRF